MKKTWLVAVLLFAAYSFLNKQQINFPSTLSNLSSNQEVKGSDAVIDNAFARHQSNLQVSGQGVVSRLLPDDNKGSRHQKFLVKIPSGLVLLIAHNIDLAPKINGLRVGDSIQFYGEYEWNEKGGVIHWTHGDPKGSHKSGWLQHDGKRYG